MKKYVVTWTFIRHVQRNREYKILTKILDAPSEYIAEFNMMHSEDVQALYKEGYDHKLKSYTEIGDVDGIPKDLHLFAIKPSGEEGLLQAFMGYTLPNGNFSFVQVPVDSQINNLLKK